MRLMSTSSSVVQLVGPYELEYVQMLQASKREIRGLRHIFDNLETVIILIERY